MPGSQQQRPSTKRVSPSVPDVSRHAVSLLPEPAISLRSQESDRGPYKGRCHFDGPSRGVLLAEGERRGRVSSCRHRWRPVHLQPEGQARLCDISDRSSTSARQLWSSSARMSSSRVRPILSILGIVKLDMVVFSPDVKLMGATCPDDSRNRQEFCSSR